MSSDKDLPEDLWDILSPRLTEERRVRMTEVAAARTRHLCLVMQDIYHPHNISACLRSAEAFGVQDIHVVDSSESFKAGKTARGVTDWLNIETHTSPKACAEALNQRGYVILAGIPAQDAIPLHQLPVEQPMALLFGNEHAGISPEWGPWIQRYFTIPMQGMVQSLNISVSAAICLHSLSRSASMKIKPEQYTLSKAEQNQLLGQWLSRQIPSWKGEYHFRKSRTDI
ncbi:MAG: RNA methyltransferase [Deltaproteobacteria bacterium]|nr:RNA methyltransferase [Deltaproteobacteria bacterium]